jgi:hypothetical protein
MMSPRPARTCLLRATVGFAALSVVGCAPVDAPQGALPVAPQPALPAPPAPAPATTPAPPVERTQAEAAPGLPEGFDEVPGGFDGQTAPSEPGRGRDRSGPTGAGNGSWGI